MFCNFKWKVLCLCVCVFVCVLFFLFTLFLFQKLVLFALCFCYGYTLCSTPLLVRNIHVLLDNVFNSVVNHHKKNHDRKHYHE